MKEFITTSQAAKVLGVTPVTIARMYDTGELHGYKVRQDRRIDVKHFRDHFRQITNNESTVKVLERRLERVLTATAA